MRAIRIDRFSTADHLSKRTRTYAAVKAAVLEAGRFSVFEAQDDPHTFNALVRDPELEKVEMEYPWVGLKRKGA